MLACMCVRPTPATPAIPLRIRIIHALSHYFALQRPPYLSPQNTRPVFHSSFSRCLSHLRVWPANEMFKNLTPWPQAVIHTNTDGDRETAGRLEGYGGCTTCIIGIRIGVLLELVSASPRHSNSGSIQA
jgi:hypothetical protein